MSVTRLFVWGLVGLLALGSTTVRAEEEMASGQDAVSSQASLSADAAEVTSTDSPAAGILEAPPAEAPVADAAAAAAQPVVEAAPVLKPITITFNGELMEVKSAETPPTITVQDRYGVKKMIEVSSDAKIAQGSNPSDLAALKMGDKLSVEYTYEVASGRRTAKMINVGETASTATP